MRNKYNAVRSADAVITVATDSVERYATELEKATARMFSDKFGESAAAEAFDRYLLGAATDHMLELGRIGRERMFNLGYYTWVEQQGVSLKDFEACGDPAFWGRLMDVVPTWDDMITDFKCQWR
ncbi:MAG: hypothetical protein OEQ39_11350 [Gammaproteobacteria bacterium]|nr:hypothetical protein [Gammaproteobacteria bacterium]